MGTIKVLVISSFSIRSYGMKKLIFISALLFSTSSFAMMHFLVTEWYASGDHFCKYDNGTVLNVGINICPLSI